MRKASKQDITVQTGITDKFVRLAELDQRLKVLARLRASALYLLLLGVVLLVFAGSGARPTQPLLPWLAGGLLSAIALPVLLVAQLLFKLRQDAHRGLVRHLFRHGHRVDYPEFVRAGEIAPVLEAGQHVRTPR